MGPAKGTDPGLAARRDLWHGSPSLPTARHGAGGRRFVGRKNQPQALGTSQIQATTLRTSSVVVRNPFSNSFFLAQQSTIEVAVAVKEATRVPSKGNWNENRAFF